ncbi:hypothetical protein AAULR_07446 [Lacticaseibacillus rhamnosus MTCC 5462]|nr:hypothetical protein AAULR_07446 [Lacticaseibacillus rhamnosus MTCC 5462]
MYVVSGKVKLLLGEQTYVAKKGKLFISTQRNNINW